MHYVAAVPAARPASSMPRDREDAADCDLVSAFQEDLVAHGLGGEVVTRVLTQVVRAHATGYPAEHYAATREWTSDSLEDVLSSWRLDRMVERDDLRRIAFHAVNDRALLAMLTTNLGWHMTTLQADNEARSLAIAVKRALRSEDRFVTVGSPQSSQGQRWALRAASAGGAAPGLSSATGNPSPDLAEFLQSVLERAGGSVAFGDLVDRCANARGLPEARLEVLDEALVERPDSGEDLLATSDAAPDRHADDAVARRVLASLRPETVETIRVCLREGGNASAAARELNVHRHTVRSRLHEPYLAVLAQLSSSGRRHTEESDASKTRAQGIYLNIIDMITGAGLEPFE
jgi:hypothetical protein